MNVLTDADYLDGKNLKIGDRIILPGGTSVQEDTLKTDTLSLLAGPVSSPSILHFTEAVQQSEMEVSVLFFAFPEKAFSLDVYTSYSAD